jgi:hypothetical protein
MGYKCYEDGQLTQERNNYSYDGLKVSYDSYSYQNGDVNDETVRHIECEYLDETFRRTKNIRSYYLNSVNNNINETYREYDGKKLLDSKSYTNGVLTAETHYNYNGLRCSYKTTYYSGNTVSQERNYEILYLDETFLREKSCLKTRKMYDTDGNITSSNTYYYVYEYNGKKPIGYQYYANGQLSYVCRDYQYDGLTCYYFKDIYRDGEVYSTSIEEVEYLE